MRVLLLGATGLLGRSLGPILAARHSVLAPARSSEYDLLDPLSLQRVISESRPDVLINCAGVASIADCDSDPELAWRINAESVRILTAVLHDLGARLVQISSDYVFSTREHGWCLETDSPEPLQVYGRTKRASEQYALAVTENLVVRLPLLFDWVAMNNWAVRLARDLVSHNEITLDDRLIRQPTLSRDAAVAVLSLLEQGTEGIAHISSPTLCTRYGFAIKLANILGLSGPSVVPSYTVPIANRPLRSPLNCSDSIPLHARPRMLAPALEEFVRELPGPSL